MLVITSCREITRPWWNIHAVSKCTWRHRSQTVHGGWSNHTFDFILIESSWQVKVTWLCFSFSTEWLGGRISNVCIFCFLLSSWNYDILNYNSLNCWFRNNWRGTKNAEWNQNGISFVKDKWWQTNLAPVPNRTNSLFTVCRKSNTGEMIRKTASHRGW